MEHNFFGLFQWKISQSKRTCEKVVLFFQVEYSKQKFMFHFFKTIFDTNFRSNIILGQSYFTSPEFCVPFVQTVE